jgi:lipopolysaccharide transport system permease protein
MGLVPLFVSFAVLGFLGVAGAAGPGLAAAVVPVVICIQLFFVAGLGLFLAALNVFVRDTALVLPNVLTIILFASPIFYPLSAYPEGAQRILAFNPFYVLSECYRAPLLENAFPPSDLLTYLACVAAVVFIGGLWWFRRLKSFFDTRL